MQQDARTKLPPVGLESEQKIREEQEAQKLEAQEFREITEIFDKRNRDRFEQYTDHTVYTDDITVTAKSEDSVSDIIRFTVKIYEEKTAGDMLSNLKPIRSPASRMLWFTEIILSPEKQKLCEAAVADWHAEYFEALDQNRAWPKMVAIRVRHTLGFIKAVIWWRAFDTLGKLIEKLTG